MRLATTGTYRDGDTLGRQAAPPYLRVGLARSLAAMLAAAPASAALCRELRALDPDRAEPVELPERAFREAGPKQSGSTTCSRTTTPADSTSSLPPCLSHVRDAIVALSPIHVAQRLRSPVEIAIAPHDTYFPVSEAQALAAASPQVRVTVTSLMAHATPRLSARYLAELRRLDAFFVRSLAAATS